MTQTELQFIDSRASQNAKILAHLQSGRRLTPMDCLTLYNCFRASGRIYDLKYGKFDGTKYPIKTEMIQVGKKRFASYSLEAK